MLFASSWKVLKGGGGGGDGLNFQDWGGGWGKYVQDSGFQLLGVFLLGGHYPIACHIQLFEHCSHDLHIYF